MDVVGFLLFTLGVLVITMVLTRKDKHDSAEGYFLGGRSLTAGVIAGSLMLTNLSTEQLVGLSGQAFSQGILVMAWEVFAAFALILMALYYLPRYLRQGMTTTPEFLEGRFDKTTRSMIDFLFLTGYIVILLPIVLVTGAKALNGMFDVQGMFGISRTASIWLIVWCIGMIGSIYAVFGGLRAVAISDTLNGIGLLVGGLAIPVLGLLRVGQGDLIRGLTVLFNTHPQKFVSNGTTQSFVPWHTLLTGMLLVNVFYWCTNQAITQRAMAAKNLKEGQKGVLLAAFLKVLGPLMLVLPGILAFHLFAHKIHAADDAYGVLVRELLGPGVLGLFAAVLLGAVLSSFNSALNSASTLFSLGFYKQYANPQASDIDVVRVGKRCTAVLACSAMLIAPFLDQAQSIFSYLQAANGFYSVPVITLFIAGFGTRWIGATAAKFGVSFGIAVYGTLTFVPKGVFAVVGLLWLKELHFLHQMMIAFASTLGLMMLFPKRETAYVQEISTKGDFDMTPWKHTRWLSVCIGLFACVVYALTWHVQTPSGPSIQNQRRDQAYRLKLKQQTSRPKVNLHLQTPTRGQK
ncbi:MAG: solute:sodium symporter family transporter [Myxococcota bacterium]